ncbi:MAG: DUF6029 family protein [Candidatus Kapabacteria bacterium]|nr:DUF6029 family protein [Candidatus Kapabacteria bacterium]
MSCKKFLLLGLVPFFMQQASAQSGGSIGSFSGNFQLDKQYYLEDKDIGAEKVKEKILSNGYFNLNYINGDFTAGIRYENYTNPLLGFNSKLKGSGVPYRYIRYNNGFVDVTAGNFYEQFGSGMIFRSYEDRQLGIDNAIDGLRVKLNPIDGIELTALIGKMRNYWNTSEAIIRAGDIDANINTLLPGLMGDDIQLNLGASIVSKYLPEKDPTLVLPENVAAGAFRFNLTGEKFSINSEFAYKANDPIYTNNKSYNDGTGFLLQASYYDDGIGISLNLHRIDNFDFRADRNATQTDYCINYLPPISKQHTYSLTNMYPYSTQLNGEVGAQAEITYTFDKSSFLGGKYPWEINLNCSYINALDTAYTEKYLYDSPFFSIGDRNFFQDYSIYASKKFSSDVKSNFGVVYQNYDRDIAEKGGAPTFGKVQTVSAVVDFTFKLAQKQYLRTEAQHQWYTQDSTVHSKEYSNGNWIALLAEYTIAPHWYFTLLDEWNYGNEYDDKQLHYYSASIAYNRGGSRVQFGYGRQRAGILCVGGVCRQVPSSNGFNLSISTSF